MLLRREDWLINNKQGDRYIELDFSRPGKPTDNAF